ncbi:amidase signature domain-containing protein [Suillus subluteus]|nr:amidase signature domain-containing protein [Suillus subluteus]
MSNSQPSSFRNRTYSLLNKYSTVSASQNVHFGVKRGMLFDTAMVLLAVLEHSILMTGAILSSDETRRKTNLKTMRRERLGMKASWTSTFRPVRPIRPQDGLVEGYFSSVQLVEAYLRRIVEVNLEGPALHAIIETNMKALSQAAALDDERKVKGSRGPLHGIPLLLKDSTATLHEEGSYALLGSVVPRDSFVAAKLREAGAIFIGKANLSEWAGMRGQVPSGFSGRGGQTLCPYYLNADPLGSSSGTAGSLGTETDGSIVDPSSRNNVVGIKPTIGLVDDAYFAALAKDFDLGRTRGIDATLAQFNLDAIILPTDALAPLPAAIAGYPLISVPLGFQPDDVEVLPETPSPLHTQAPGLPFGISFVGTAYSEFKLIGYAYAFEQATHVRLKRRVYDECAILENRSLIRL